MGTGRTRSPAISSALSPLASAVSLWELGRDRQLDILRGASGTGVLCRGTGRELRPSDARPAGGAFPADLDTCACVFPEAEGHDAVPQT